jgi:hypothetical protein
VSPKLLTCGDESRQFLVIALEVVQMAEVVHMYKGRWRLVKKRNRVVREIDRSPLTIPDVV